MRYRDTRKLRAKKDGSVDIRNATISCRPGGGWQISIAVRCEITERPVPSEAVGIDRGVAVPYALSTGEMIRLPGTVPGLERAQRRAQEELSRGKRGSRRYAAARAQLAKLKGKLARIRAYAAHVLSRDLAGRFGLVAIEDLNIRSMTRSARGTREAPGATSPRSPA